MKPNFDRNEINNAICICTGMMTYYYGLMQKTEPEPSERDDLDEKRAARFMARKLLKGLLEGEV